MIKNESKNVVFNLEVFNVPDQLSSLIPFYDSQALLEKLREIEDNDGEIDASASAIIHKENGDSLHVGMGPDAWILILKEKGEPTRILSGEVQPGEPVAFLIPIWTDFERKKSVNPVTARAAVERWLAGEDIKPRFNYKDKKR